MRDYQDSRVTLVKGSTEWKREVEVEGGWEGVSEGNLSIKSQAKERMWAA